MRQTLMGLWLRLQKNRVVKIVGGGILLILLLVLGGCIRLRASLPTVNGITTLTGIHGVIEIVRDADGVPHVFASTEHDAFFAQGYVHAQDRMWQLEFQRRIAAGRLSEIIGDATLGTDKFIRTLGVYRIAKETWPHLSPRGQMAIQAYTDGVNAWLDEGHTLPLEFDILQHTPEPWTVYDSLAWGKMMAWNMGGNYKGELLRFQLAQAVGLERANQLMAGYPEDGTTILSTGEISNETSQFLLDMDTYLQHSLHLGGLDVGSNNWVIGGDMTESGLPLLANDPHLAANAPAIWYLIELQGGKLHVTGASFPGLPSVGIGHNEDIVWGITNLGADVQDLYIERINPENVNQYEVEGEWVDMTIVEEKIYVKGEDEPILWAARSTRHGPLISDPSNNALMPIAMRWTALDEDDTTVDSFVSMNYASDWESFTEALKSYVNPNINLVYADKEGNIGYYGAGRIPIRAKGEGVLPVPGWNSEYEWTGWIPFEELPHTYNPEAGFIVTANNKVTPPEYPYFLTNEWATPHRATRIIELIEDLTRGGHKLNLEDMITIQGDLDSIQSRDLLPLLLKVTPTDDRQTEAIAYLEAWDGSTGVESVATTIYQAWFMHLGRALYEDDLNDSLEESFLDRRYEYTIFLDATLKEADHTWCDNFLTTPIEDCYDIAQIALDNALDELEAYLGSNMANWQWGEVHKTQFPHAFSENPWLKPLFHREIASGGDGYTVNVAPPRFSEPFAQYHMPGYRHIVNVDNWNDSLFIIAPGQSGNIFSTHYDDLMEPHQTMQYLPMTFGRDNVRGDRLTLTPN